jgi:hypothetical protein
VTEATLLQLLKAKAPIDIIFGGMSKSLIFSPFKYR